MAEWVWRGYWGSTFVDTAKQEAEALPATMVGAIFPARNAPAVAISNNTIRFFMIAIRSDQTPPALTGVSQNDSIVVTYLNIFYGG
jgi:hypothetical protein